MFRLRRGRPSSCLTPEIHVLGDPVNAPAGHHVGGPVGGGDLSGPTMLPGWWRRSVSATWCPVWKSKEPVTSISWRPRPLFIPSMDQSRPTPPAALAAARRCLDGHPRFRPGGRQCGGRAVPAGTRYAGKSQRVWSASASQPRVGHGHSRPDDDPDVRGRLAVVTDHPLAIPFRLSRAGSTNRTAMSGSYHARVLQINAAGHPSIAARVVAEAPAGIGRSPLACWSGLVVHRKCAGLAAWGLRVVRRGVGVTGMQWQWSAGVLLVAALVVTRGCGNDDSPGAERRLSRRARPVRSSGWA